MPKKMTKRPGKKNICIDLDGVIAEYDGWKGVQYVGEPIKGAKEFIAELRKHYNVVVHTTRANENLNGKGTIKYLTEWLKKHKIEVDGIEAKPLAVAYIDDRAINCTPQRSAKCWDYFKYAAQQIQMLDPGTKFRFEYEE